MNKFMKCLLMTSGFLLTMSNMSFGADNVPWSQEPPGGLDVSQVPLFVSIGFDDNDSDMGMNWITDYMRNLNNPAGTGNAGTFDGKPARVTFFNTTSYIDSSHSNGAYAAYVKPAWQTAYDDGHEIGNHTRTHSHGVAFSIADWTNEIGTAHNWLTAGGTAGAGMTLPASEVTGFRTPFLEWNDNTLTVLQNLGYAYDTSIQEGTQQVGGEVFDGTNFAWPYTLDNGSPADPKVTAHPGLWEMPAYPVIVASDNTRLTGFDYNMWVLKQMNKDEFLNTLKKTLDLRLAGNRAPFLFGAHAGEYDEYFDAHAPEAPNHLDRRAAIEEFIQYALSLEVDGRKVVRIVPYKDILSWMKNPVELYPMITTKLVGHPKWDETINYPEFQEVYHNGKEWRNKYWANVGQEPGVIVENVDNPWERIAEGQSTLMNYMGSISVTHNGVTTPASSAEVVPGEIYIYTFTPDAGKFIKNVKIDGQDVGIIPSYTFQADSTSHSIEVEFTDVPVGNTQTIAASSGANGMISPTGNFQVLEGANMTLTMIPNEGYEVAQITVNGTVEAAAPTYTFTNVTTAQDISVEFSALASHDIISTYVGNNGLPPDGMVITNGTISPAGTVTVYAGQSKTYTITPDTGYRTKSILVDGVSVAITDSYTFENVTGAHTIEAEFEAIPIWTISATTGPNGTVTPLGNSSVIDGKSMNYTITAAQGYGVADVLVDGISVGAVTSHTISNVTSNRTISASFVAVPSYTITTSVAGTVAGSIAPSGVVSVYQGSPQDFTFAHADGVHVKTILVDGVEVPTENFYTFINVDANHTISVEFAEDGMSSSDIDIAYAIQQDWNTGFGANVTITNLSTTEPLNDWALTWNYSGNQEITSVWEANYTQQGTLVTVNGVSYNKDLAPGASVTFGVNGNYTGVNNNPIDFTLNGNNSSVQSSVKAPVWTGFRSSIYGVIDPEGQGTYEFNPATDWVEGLNHLSNSISAGASKPAVVWIIGTVYTEDPITGGTALEMDQPAGNHDPSILFRPYTDHDAYLTQFCQDGVDVFLQVEAGHSDMLELIDLVFNKWGHHECVVGFGIDVEWYKNSNEAGGGSASLDWATAQTYINRVKSFNPNHKMFVKHWLKENLPQRPAGTVPAEWNDMIFIDDTQGEANWDVWTNEMLEFANHFAPNHVGFQIGYNTDWNIWFNTMNPSWGAAVPQDQHLSLSKRLSDRLAQGLSADQDYSIFWVDFSMRKLVPSAMVSIPGGPVPTPDTFVTP